jgi:hypothetical protein
MTSVLDMTSMLDVKFACQPLVRLIEEVVMLCVGSTPAKKRYERDVLWIMAVYAVLLLGSSWVVKHTHVVGPVLYFWSVLPAVPIIAVMARLGRYFQEETDEFLKAQRVRSILVGTAALLGALVVDDFLRAFAHYDGFEPFVLFAFFAVANAISELVQFLIYRVRDDA